MVSNDLFRLVSLRQSERHGGGNGVSDANNPEATPPDRAPDPRVQHKDLVAAQARVAASRQENRLNSLKKRHADVSKKVRDLESVQDAVVKAVMLERQEAERSAPAAASLNNGRPIAIKPASRLSRQIEARLDVPQKALYRDTLNRVRGAADIDTLLSGLAVEAHIVDANKICAEIRAIEEDLSLDLPAVGATQAAFRPSVVAVGWGDLVVARETLVGYTAQEIAHIENILPGESKLREHSRLSRTEEVTESESLSERETEKDSQTTERYELHAESQETINRDFAVSAGVNVTAKYGVTQVETSLDAAFSQSSSQSRSNSVETAREIVSKAVERTLERVRKLRRLTITEETRELNRHELANVGGPAPAGAVSGMYLWVEKIERVELRHYGTRMMIEFHIPEPAMSLFERTSRRNVRRRLPAFDVGPPDINFGNYMCLAQRYGAFDVEPPPTQFVNVGYGWVSSKNEDDESFAEDQFTAMIQVPDGYRPEWAKVAWSGLRGNSTEFNFAFSIGGVSQNQEHTVFTYDGVVLQLPPKSIWPQGVPVSGRVHGHWDSTMYVQATLSCVRTEEAVEAWRIRTWEALRAGYEALERKLSVDEAERLAEEEKSGPMIAGRPAAENRRIERGELQKWAIKSMRIVPQNFNAIEQVSELQEMSPHHAEAQAPIVRFYEDSFEWEHMTYFLYPYHWARRDSWRMRADARSVDPKYQAFLEAGAARVIVPVTPGHEDKVLAYLDPHSTGDELTRILAPPPQTPPAASSDPFRDVWIELLTERKPDLARGSGTLAVTNGSPEVTINDDSRWDATDQDIGRELYIAGDRHVVAERLGDRSVRLDRPYEGATDPAALYAAGSVPYGPPWTVNVPTTLIVLAENLPALRVVGSS